MLGFKKLIQFRTKTLTKFGFFPAQVLRQIVYSFGVRTSGERFIEPLTLQKSIEKTKHYFMQRWGPLPPTPQAPIHMFSSGRIAPYVFYLSRCGPQILRCRPRVKEFWYAVINIEMCSHYIFRDNRVYIHWH